MRHGLDADHLATIDGLTRFGRRAGVAHARYAGALFSFGPRCSSRSWVWRCARAAACAGKRRAGSRSVARGPPSCS
ncbi:MAG: hypothetical protein NTZ79_10025 [Proteobacteria bacterium]|nr:hypothetical protein [Pseudomonadota bacterium]